MNKDIIGIKLADGSFYPVLTSGKPSEKQLKLTTARDGQTSIRLHLYRSAFGTMEDAEYIDSLRIDGLSPHVMNEPTISFSLAMSDDGTISAQLSDSETGTFASKTVSIPMTEVPLPPIDEEPADVDMPATDEISEIADMPDIPDFDFGSDSVDENPLNFDLDIPEPQDSSSFDVPPLTDEDLDFDFGETDDAPADTSNPVIMDEDFQGSKTADIIPDLGTKASGDDFSMQGSPFTDSSLYDGLASENKKKKGTISIPVAISIVCAVICLFVLAIMLFISPPKWLSRIQEEIPGYTYDGELIPEDASQNGISPNEDIIIVADEPIIPEQPVLVEPDAADENGQIKHLVKWGDTLWDIAGCYYKNPWAYPRIAKENNIKNPDFIVSGTILVIPR